MGGRGEVDEIYATVTKIINEVVFLSRARVCGVNAKSKLDDVILIWYIYFDLGSRNATEPRRIRFEKSFACEIVQA